MTEIVDCARIENALLYEEYKVCKRVEGKWSELYEWYMTHLQSLHCKLICIHVWEKIVIVEPNLGRKNINIQQPKKVTTL